MSAEATDHAVLGRRRGLPRIDLRNLRRFSRAALLGSPARGRLPDAIEHVAKVHRAHHPGADLDVLRKAYVLAESSHRGQMRKSGEPYITHPLAVTLILAELGAETTTLTASLLHDTVEDTDVTLDQVGEQFGEEVRYLVDGVTKLEKVDYGAAAEPETFRKMLVATGNDVRVMSIKLADRLHNMRTLGVMRPEKQARIAKVTRDVLIPLAERLGVQALKTELEDLVFAILHPAEYARTRELLLEHAGRPDPLAHAAEDVRAVLHEAGIAAEVLVRPRHFVSVHRVGIKRGELTGSDLGRLLVLVSEDADCYAVLGELHTCFTPVISEFKDFIAVPKFNLYQSLHTAVAGRDGEVAEVLIRTHQMHLVAEAGVIALGNPYATNAPNAPVEAADALDGERAELAQDREITVFRADGGTLGLPAGASCVDAAYAQYGEAAHDCIGARVNGRIATLSTVLRDGDMLQLLMARDTRDAASSGPSPEWLDHARTPAARIAISHWLAANPERQQPQSDPAPDPAPAEYQAGAGAPGGAEARATVAPGVAADLPGAAVRLAGCCTPVPPDAVIGFAVRGGTVTVHREQCPAVSRMTATGRGTVGVRWLDGEGGDGGDYRVTLLAEAFSRPRLLADLTEAIAAEGVAVVSAAVEPPREQRVRHTYTLQLPDPGRLPTLMRAMRDVPGVYDVTRAGRSMAAARS
ncbi:RelA/SpoT family protein [Streptomyces milbemycinicus]|uniref:RelA/SpoT family protein n=1 Tax=Streptomyces milbemycinicus TaxID=476552 RepID=UPI000A35EC55|nr:HD domain-containing protein [Streptomyces milbemycinicus]